ncbi:MAG: transposase [Candidatus Omnitrophota bacterium]|nr:transposase [Candidatus Omnitrophota bacterium]
MEEIYHVCNRSISEMDIFTNNNEYIRFINAVRFYQIEKPQIKFSDFLEHKSHRRGGINQDILFPEKERLVQIIAYCIMPTHFHLLLGQLKKGGISIFTNNLLNSYTRYFNTRYKRKGTLWEGKSKRIMLESDEQLLHLTRYIHLNPVTAYLVDSPEKWRWSSYCEYIEEVSGVNKICNYSSIMDVRPDGYKQFVEDGIAYQREMARAKKANPTAAVG